MPRRDAGKGKGTGRAVRRKGEAKDREEGEEELVPPESARGPRKGKGRGQKGKGKGSDGWRPSEDDEADEDQEGEEGLPSGKQLLNILKANPPKTTRYTKGELLSIARLPASNQKPASLSPLIDKENKESPLLVRLAGDWEEEGGEGHGRRDHRRERERQPRVEEPEDNNHGQGDQAAAKGSQAEPKASASAPPAAAAATDRNGDAAATSRGFNNWFPSKKPDTPTGASTAATAPGEAAGQAAGSVGVQGYTQLLQTHAAAAAAAAAQAQALQAAQVAQVAHAAQAVQAAQAQAYMQALHAVAAGRGPANYANPWGFPPYMYPYSNPYGGAGLPGAGGVDYSAFAAQAKMAAVQAALNPNAAAFTAGASLGGRTAAASSKAAQAKGKAAGLQAPKAPPAAGVSAAAKAAPAAAPPAAAKKAAAPTPPPAAPAPAGEVPQEKPGEEDTEGCAQS